MRHGESTANYTKTFTGWSDVSLTKKGKADARMAGQLIKDTQILFDGAHTSYLKRAIETENLVLEEINQLYISQFKTWRLNERHYGALRGKQKATVKEQVGETQFKEWRRSFTAVPPQLENVAETRIYRQAGIKEPRAESLEMAYNRLLPYWIDQLAPALKAGKNELVVAHGSSLRALIKYLEKIDNQGIDGVEVENTTPIIYTLDSNLNILNKEILKN